MKALERTTARVAKYVAAGDKCAATGAMASAKAWWWRAGMNYSIAHGLADARERGIQRCKRRHS